jgi:hypothetical protein
MSDIILKEENVRKAHSEGNAEIKKMWETACPEVFRTDYPCYMKSPCRIHRGDLIVYFTGYKEGVVVSTPSPLWKVGHRSVEWDMSEFTPIKGIQEIPE